MRGIERIARDAWPMIRVPLMLPISGASGAVASTFKGQHLLDGTPPVRTAAGKYTITLDKPSKGGVVSFQGSVKQATGVAPLTVVHTANDGTTTSGTPPVCTITFETRVAAGTPTDPADGDVIYVVLGIDSLGEAR